MANNPPPVEDRRLELSDLPDDMLMEILSRVPVNELLAVESVSRTWKRCVGLALNKVDVIVFDRDDDKAIPVDINPTCSHLQLARNNRQTLFVNVDKFRKRWGQDCFWIKDEKSHSLIRLLKRCPQVKCLDFSHIRVRKRCLGRLTKVCPELECLSFWPVLILDCTQDDSEWHQITKRISTKLIHLKINGDGICLKNSFFNFNLLINGDKLRWVYLSFHINFIRFLDQMRNRPEIELSLDIDWLSLEYDFSCFNRLTFVVNKLTPTCRSLFKENDASIVFDFSETLKVSKFSSDQLFLLELLIVFKTLKCLEMDSIKLDKNSFKCRFERLKTLHLINTSAKEDSDFVHLFGSMQQLKKMVIRIYKWQPNYQHFSGQSLTVLKRLEIIEIEVDIEKPEQIRMTKLFDALMQMLSLKCVEITCNFNRYLIVSEVIKKSLLVSIVLCSSTKLNVELRFNKLEFGDDVNEEVMEWYAMACRFEEISQQYSEEEKVYKIKITSKNH